MNSSSAVSWNRHKNKAEDMVFSEPVSCFKKRNNYLGVVNSQMKQYSCFLLTPFLL